MGAEADSTSLEEDRRAAAKAIAAHVLQRRERGEHAPDEQIVASHPDLEPHLTEELELVARIRLAYLSARKLHAAVPVEILSDEALAAPIGLHEDCENSVTNDGTPPVVAITGYVGLEEISHGGQATVYKAVQDSTGRVVAIKVMPGGSLAGSRHRARFDREAKLLASLNHPNIVSILDRGRSADGSFYLVMEYIEGRDLDSFWTKCIPADEAGTKQLVQLFLKLATAVEEAHARGIVHRDLKPPNVRVDTRGEPHVLDFGLASGASAMGRSVTQSGQLLGSLPWSSPEQASGRAKALDARSDVYSLGVMLYQALTGRFPYATDGEIRELLNNIATAAPLPPRKVKGARYCGTALESVVMRALAKEPSDRYDSAGGLAADLQNVLDGSAVVATGRRRSKRHLLVVLITVLSLVTPLAILAYWKVYASSPPVVFTLPSITNSIGIRLVRISPGSFLMGSPAHESDGRVFEGQKLVTIEHPYFIGVTEVTQRQYQAIMGVNPSDPRWRGDDLPVQQVSWTDANEFCRRLSERERRSYRLPNEAEWEYACRGGTKGAYSGSQRLDDMGWYADNSNAQVHTVATKWANAWGLFDMHGNVGEWCADFYPSASDIASAPHKHMIAGGSVLHPALDCRSASHLHAAEQSRFRDVGFRIALDPFQP